MASPPSNPVLTRPSYGGYYQGSGVAFQWQASSGAKDYNLQIASDANFANVVYGGWVGGAYTNQTVTGFPDNGQWYYWAVQAWNYDGSSGWSYSYFKNGPSAAPAQVTLSSPASGATVNGTTVTFQWNAAARAYDYYLEVATDAGFTDMVFDNYVGGTYTSLQLTGMPDNGQTFYWRVAAWNELGFGTDSSTRTVKNGPTSVPAQVTLSSPASGATVNGTSVTFQWGAAARAADYYLEVATDAGFTDIVYGDYVGGTYTSLQLTGMPDNGQTFYWRVASWNEKGFGTDSAARTVKNGPTSAPAQVTLSSPASGATVNGTSVNFQWNAAARAADYYLEVATDAGFTDMVYDDYVGGTYTSMQLTGMPDNGQTFYWRVAAYNEKGWGADSATRSVKNGPTSAPAQVVLSSPASGATVNGTSVTFQWGSTARAADYYLEVATDAGFTDIVYGDYVGGTYTSQQLSDMPDNGQTFYWRVAAYNEKGWGSDSTARNVKNGPSAVPAQVALSSPASGATVNGTTVMFEWGEAARAADYYLEVATDAGFTDIVYGDFVGGLYTSLELSNMPDNGQTVCWRVAAWNELGFGSDSTARNVKNGPSAVPAQVVLSSPASGATVNGTTVTFEWGAAARAADYYLEVATDAGFTDIVYGDYIGGPYTNLELSEMPDNGQTFYWRVAALNELGFGTDSTARNVKNGPSAVPAQTVLSSPAGGATVNGTSVNFQWNAAARASDYYLEVATDDGFVNIVFGDYVDGPYTSLQLNGLPDNGQPFYWRVAAWNELGFGTDSTARNFKNGPSAAPAQVVLSSPASGATVDGTNMTFRWNAAVRAADYYLELATDSGFGNIVFGQFIGGPYTNQTITGMPDNGQIFYWRVASWNEVDWGPDSAARNVKNGPTSEPAQVVLSSPADGATVSGELVSLRWNRADRASDYYLYIGRDSALSDVIYEDWLGGNYLGMDMHGFPGIGLDYYWAVFAWNEKGDGALSDIRHFVNGSRVSIPPPANLTATGGTETITISWSPVAAPSSPLTVGYYNLYYGTSDPQGGTIDGMVQLESSQAGGVALPFSSSGTHYFRMKTVFKYGSDIYGESDQFSNLAMAQLNTAEKPPTPTGLAVNNPGTGNRLDLSWNAVSVEGLNHYHILRQTGHAPNLDANDFDLSPLVGPGVTSWSDFNVAQGVTYYYTIQTATAQDTEGPHGSHHSDPSSPVSGTPTDNLAPQAPGNFSGVSQNGLVSLTWSMPLHNTDGSPFTDFAHFQLDRWNDDFEAWEEIAVPAGVGYLDDDPALLGDQTYSYRVQAVDGHGNGGAYTSTTVQVDSVDLPPAPPTGLVVRDTGGQNVSLTLSWTASSESDIDHYNVYRRTGNQGAFTLLAEDVNGASYEDRTVQCGVQYTYYVTAVDAAEQESDPSNYASNTPSLLRIIEPLTSDPATLLTYEGDIVDIVWEVSKDYKARYPNAVVHLEIANAASGEIVYDGNESVPLGSDKGVRTFVWNGKKKGDGNFVDGGEYTCTLKLQPSNTGPVAAEVSEPRSINVGVLKVGLVPDYNRDGSIDGTDRARVAANETFHFWVNDDNDNGYDGGDDIPGNGSANYADDHVNGVRDLIDFFPVWVDIRDTLAILSPNEYDYVLKNQSGALNAFACNSLPVSSNPDLKPNAFLYSMNFGNTYGTFSVRQITSSGLTLSTGFLDGIINNGRGIILLEGRTATTLPLVLEVRRKSDSAVIVQTGLPLSLSGVENMYRHINLRPSGGHATSTGEPSNYPDSLCNSKNVFFIHGFHTDGEYARGINAEMFKRLYWSGSNAKFWGITWQGDVGWPDAFHYHDNVANAFSVATNLTAHLNGILGTKVILAHSLGNMVVSSAIQDCGLSVNDYFMMNAAVAAECYWPAAFNDSTNGNYMQHDDWFGYNSNTWCSTWFRLFSAPDDRAKLTWKGRFPSVLSVGHNFYTSGDNIFEIYANGTPSVPAGWFDFERYAWQKQEMYKGRSIPGGTSLAGWGFSDGYTMAQANAATDDNLRTNAVFRHEPTEMFSSTITTQNVNNILAQGIPALSCAAGRNAITPVGWDESYNYNMENNKPNGWPRNDSTYIDRWLHSDYKNMAYLYTYDLFKTIVSQGGLQ